MQSTIRRVDFGYFIRPAEETATGVPRAEPVLGYVVRHPRGVLLFDTGMGEHPDVDAHYRPRRVPLAAALHAAHLSTPPDVIVNCHLHFDHCGGNPDLLGRPIFVQRAELEAARKDDYTLPHLVDVPGSRYEELDGETEIWSDVLVIPTPGHTDGHQSIVIRQPDGSVVVLAGQSHDTASAYSADVLARRAEADGHASLPTPAWMQRLHDLDPRVVFFAHDHSVWMPG
jgi:N-acyl homoserine lactone hydrolase